MKLTNKTNGFLFINNLTLEPIRLQANESVILKNPNLANNYQFILDLYKDKLEVDFSINEEKSKIDNNEVENLEDSKQDENQGESQDPKKSTSRRRTSKKETE